MTEYEMPPNTKKADYIWAYLSEDGEGRHGIIGCIVPGMGSTPLVSMSEKVAGMMKEKAEQVQRETGIKVVLARFILESITSISKE